MAYSVDWVSKVITIPTSDLDLVSGTRYQLQMADFLQECRRLEWAFTDGLWAPPILDHSNTRFDFAGVDYAPFDEIINDYTLQVTGVATRVDLLGSNNNIIDVLIVTGVSIVPSNSAGLQIVTSGSGVTEQDKTDIITGVLTDNMTEAYPVDGQSAMNLTQANYAMVQLLSEFVRSGATVSVKKRDGVTEAIELTLDSATAPTQSTQSG